MAQIISFPNSAAAPVQQRRGPGRHPKMVVKLRTWRLKKGVQTPKLSAAFLDGFAQGWRDADEGLRVGVVATKALQDQLASEREVLSLLESMVNSHRQKVAVMKQQCAQAAEAAL